LILVVLVQNSKGGGLASSFSSSNQVMGVRKTADFLEKATWTLAVALLALSLASTAYNKPSEGAATSNSNSSVSKSMAGQKSPSSSSSANPANGGTKPAANPGAPNAVPSNAVPVNAQPVKPAPAPANGK
jgi:preprotein translocase subunit SecG